MTGIAGQGGGNMRRALADGDVVVMAALARRARLVVRKGHDQG